VDFRAAARLVEVYATVTDGRGRYIDNLSSDQFTVLDEHDPQRITAFESQGSEVSCALLLDTTGSMQLALPSLKSAALKLIGDLRPADSVAVYSFSESVTELQALSTDKAAAKRAVLRAQAQGQTALYDALTLVAHDLASRPGKKVIVLFTDGKDNASTLTAETAITRAKAVGIPVYTIAEGEAVTEPVLVAQLASISKATGGESFVIRNAGEIGRVFEKVSEDLAHGYLLSFPPPSTENNEWRTIEVSVSTRGAKVHARAGYYPQSGTE
jgi:Ca-activated chloride channel family protein